MYIVYIIYIYIIYYIYICSHAFTMCTPHTGNWAF